LKETPQARSFFAFVSPRPFPFAFPASFAREVSTPLALPMLEHRTPIWRSTANRAQHVRGVPYVYRRDISIHKPNLPPVLIGYQGNCCSAMRLCSSCSSSSSNSAAATVAATALATAPAATAAATAAIRFVQLLRAHRCSSLPRASRHFNSSVACNPARSTLGYFGTSLVR